MDGCKGAVEDHPRLRGEKVFGAAPDCTQLGSPPLTRGKVVLCYMMGIDYGITPAYAGKSGREQRGRGECQDHPRLRGEKGQRSRQLRREQGSPPLTRGKDTDSIHIKGTDRITPAYAGKSGNVCSTHISIRDHPRLRGEK